MSAILNVWPQLGTTVTLASSYVITAAGVQAALTEEIGELLSEARLLDSDPTQLYPNPSPIPPIGGSGGTTVSSMASLALVTGSADGASAQCLGFYEANDDGAGTFYWVAGATDTEVPGMIVAAYGGRWFRSFDVAMINVKWFGAKGDATGVSGAGTDDTTALQAALDYAISLGGEVYFPRGQYRITSTLRVGTQRTPSQTAVKLRGVASGYYDAATVIYWDGVGFGATPAGSSTALWLTGYGFSVEHMKIQCCLTKECEILIQVGNSINSQTFSSNCRFKGMVMDTASQDRAFNVGVAFGSTYPVSSFNLENMVFEDCLFRGMAEAGVGFYSGQPYNTSFFRCSFSGDQIQPSGIGLYCNVASANFNLTDCDYQSLEVAVSLSRWASLNVTAGEAERCKKVLLVGSPSDGLPGAATFNNVRFNGTNINVASLGPLVFLAADHKYIELRAGVALSLRGCYLDDSDVDVQLYAKQDSTVITENCTWGVANPFTLVAGASGNTGGVWSRGDRRMTASAPVGSQTVPMPTLEGSVVPSFTVTISDASTSGSPDFTTLGYSDEVAADYKVRIAVESFTGTPTLSQPYVTSKATTGFTVNLPTAPGVGNTVTLRCTPYR